MRNHFHLVIETPKANLVEGMKWLLGAYTGRFNLRQSGAGAWAAENSGTNCWRKCSSARGLAFRSGGSGVTLARST